LEVHVATGTTVVTITHSDDISIDVTKKNKSIAALVNHIQAVGAGVKAGPIDVKQNGGDGVAASAVVTCAAVAAADTITINGVVFTAVAGAPAGNQFDQSGTDTADAASLVNAINTSASALVNQHVTASNVAGVVTITAKNKGAVGNAITIATSTGVRLAITGGVSRLTGGVDATAQQLQF
jgi:hypothetical protein